MASTTSEEQAREAASAPGFADLFADNFQAGRYPDFGAEISRQGE